MNKLEYILSTIIGIVLVSVAYSWGQDKIIDSCLNYGSYRNKDYVIMCVVRPVVDKNQGDLIYMRPNGKKVEPDASQH